MTRNRAANADAREVLTQSLVLIEALILSGVAGASLLLVREVRNPR